jgi:hypothetical protein
MAASINLLGGPSSAQNTAVLSSKERATTGSTPSNGTVTVNAPEFL